MEIILIMKISTTLIIFSSQPLQRALLLDAYSTRNSSFAALFVFVDFLFVALLEDAFADDDVDEETPTIEVTRINIIP